MEAENCSICLDEIGHTKNHTITQCKHHFCTSCLLDHIKTSNLCPICRRVLTDKPQPKTMSETLCHNIVSAATDAYNFTRPAARMYKQLFHNDDINADAIQMLRDFADDAFILGAQQSCIEVNNYIETDNIDPGTYFDDIFSVGPPDHTSLVSRNVDNIEYFIASLVPVTPQQ